MESNKSVENLNWIQPTPLGRGTTDCQTTDHQARLSDAHRHPLARFTAIANAGIKGQIIADTTDLFQRGRPVSDLGRTFDWRANDTVLHAVGFGA